MHVPSRLQWVVIAVAVLPGWAAAQSALGSSKTDTPFTGSQYSATPVAAPVAVDRPAQLGDAGATAAIPLPPANLEVEPIPAPQSDEATASSVDVADGRPTMAGVTAGIHAHTATEDLTRQQLADRAASSHGHVGTDAALMIVGGAGLIAGLLIGGGAGTAIAIAGAVMGLYGLYLYLQ